MTKKIVQYKLILEKVLSLFRQNIHIKQLKYIYFKCLFQENDLNFSKGDKIQVLKKPKNGWWIGLFKNNIGYFPSNYVDSCNSSVVIE